MPIGYWVKRLDAALQAQLDFTLAGVHLSGRHWKVLTTLSVAPVRPAEMLDILQPFNAVDGVDGQERDVAALVRRGLMLLLDGRFALTGAGHALQSRASGMLEATGRELTAGIGADEFAMAVSVLERMSINAERLASR